MRGERECFPYIVQRSLIKLLGGSRNNGAGERARWTRCSQITVNSSEQLHHGRCETSCPTLADSDWSYPSCWVLGSERLESGCRVRSSLLRCFGERWLTFLDCFLKSGNNHSTSHRRSARMKQQGCAAHVTDRLTFSPHKHHFINRDHLPPTPKTIEGERVPSVCKR